MARLEYGRSTHDFGAREGRRAGRGIGNSLHAGQVCVADGSNEAARRLERVLTNDPGLGIARHADAGYPEALAAAERHGIRLPMRETPG